MTEITIEHLIGKLFRTADEYLEEYLIGGRQKLQRLLGDEIFYQNTKNKQFYWNIEKIKTMAIEELQTLCDKVYLAKKKVIISKRTALK